MEKETGLLIGTGLQALGAALVGYMALSVHDHVRKEKRVDQYVFGVMGKEQFFGRIGLAMILSGFLVEVLFFFL